MKVRLIVRVPKRLLAGRLGSALDVAPEEEASTATTLNSLLAFDEPDYVEELNGTSNGTSGLEGPEAAHDAADLPEAPELSHLLDFDEIEAWSKSTGTQPEQSDLFGAESEPPTAEEIETPEPPVETSGASMPPVREEVQEEVHEKIEEGRNAVLDDFDWALLQAESEASAEQESAEAAPDAEQENVAEKKDQGLDEAAPTAELTTEEADVEASATASEEPESEFPLVSEEPPAPEPSTFSKVSAEDDDSGELDLAEEEGARDGTGDAPQEEPADTVQNLGARDDVVRDALSSMAWWQRWEKLEQSASEETADQEFSAEQEPAELREKPEETLESQTSERALDVEEAASAEQTPDEKVFQLDKATEPDSIDSEPSFPATDTAQDEEPVNWLQESKSEQVDEPADLPRAEGATADTSTPETSAPDTGSEEPYIPATPGTGDLRQALEQEEAGVQETTAQDEAVQDADTVYSWSAFDRPQGRLMVPVSEKAITNRRRRNIAAISAVVVLILGSAGWLYKAQTDPIRALKSMESGRRRLAVGDYGEAILDLNNAISIDPDNPQIVEAYLMRGRAHVAMGRAEDALPDFTQAIQRAPNNVTAYLDRGLAYYDVGLYNQALSDGGKIIELDDQSADGYALHGMALRETGKLEEAMDDFNRAVELEPNLANRLQRGLLLQKLGRHEEAIEDFNEAIYLNPSSPTAYFSRAQSLRELGKDDAASQDHRTARYLDGR